MFLTWQPLHKQTLLVKKSLLVALFHNKQVLDNLLASALHKPQHFYGLVCYLLG